MKHRYPTGTGSRFNWSREHFSANFDRMGKVPSPIRLHAAHSSCQKCRLPGLSHKNKGTPSTQTGSPRFQTHFLIIITFLSGQNRHQQSAEKAECRPKGTHDQKNQPHALQRPAVCLPRFSGHISDLHGTAHRKPVSDGVHMVSAPGGHIAVQAVFFIDLPVVFRPFYTVIIYRGIFLYALIFPAIHLIFHDRTGIGNRTMSGIHTAALMGDHRPHNAFRIFVFSQLIPDQNRDGCQTYHHAHDQNKNCLLYTSDAADEL